jgi:hypothetical protein
MIHFDHVDFRYDPFPIGVATQLFDEGLYRDLVATYPPTSAFVVDRGVTGRRYTLARHANAAAYRAHLRQAPAWRELSRYVRSRTFVHSVADMLLAHAIDLQIPRQPAPLAGRLLRFAKLAATRRRLPHWSRMPGTELVFAMLPADGGSLHPHTDHPSKMLNLAIPMVAPGEWDAAIGGHTNINRPKDVKRWFNRGNQWLAFDEVDVLETVPYRPNQALVVIRGDNTWHSVPPMTATGSPVMRRTVNINITTW